MKALCNKTSLGSMHLFPRYLAVSSFSAFYRTGRHLCRETLHLCRSPLLSNRLHTLRSLPLAASTPHQNSSAKDLGDGFSVRRQLQDGKRLSKVQIRGYKVAQLRDALQEEGLSTKGLKAELVERLYELVQSLSQEAKGSAGPLDLPDTAERSLQAQAPGTSPEDPAQDALQSRVLDAQSEPPELHEDATAGDNSLASIPNMAFASDTQHSAGAASRNEEIAMDQLDSLSMADAQRRHASHDIVSAEDANLTIAAVPVSSATQHGSSSPSRDLEIPDPVASKTGTRTAPVLFKKDPYRLMLSVTSSGRTLLH